MEMAAKFTVNGKGISHNLPEGTPLLYFLRNDLGLNGPKFGCGLGQCGACTVLVDGIAVRSCQTQLQDVEGQSVTTLEGIGTRDKPHAIQKAFIEKQAAQCGYCSNGMMMTAVALLDEVPKPSALEIKQALNGNLCRCGTHTRIIAAVQAAAEASGHD